MYLLYFTRVFAGNFKRALLVRYRTPRVPWGGEVAYTSSGLSVDVPEVCVCQLLLLITRGYMLKLENKPLACSALEEEMFASFHWQVE